MPRVAPYAPASAVSEFFDHIRYVRTPNKVDSDLLQDYGLSKSQSFPVLSTLKFLGITEADGTPTPGFRALQTGGDEFQEALRGLIEAAYGDLFSRLDVSRDSRDKILNYFARNYSPATAERATALFLDLCGEAGIASSAGSGSRKASAEKAPIAPRGKAAGRARQHTPPPPQPENGRAVLEIRLTQEDLGAMEPDDIEAIFKAAASIEVARAKVRAKPVADPTSDGADPGESRVEG